MKPPRVYIRGRYFWVEYWNPQTKATVKTPILDGPYSIEADIERPENPSPDWWKKSKRRKAISEFLDGVELIRVKLKNWETTVRTKPKDLTLDKLLEAYNERRELKAGVVTPHRMQSRTSAILFLKRYGVETVRQLTETKLLGIRRQALIDYEASTVQKYFYDLKTMFDLALKLIGLAENPFEGIRIEVADKVVEVLGLETEMRIFDKVRAARPALAEQALYLRLTGCRALDSCKPDLYSRLDFDNRLIDFQNNKKKRVYLYPMPETVFHLLKDKRGLQWERSPKTLGEKMERWSNGECRVHILKAGFATEVEPYCQTDRLRDFVTHHKPKGIGPKFYLEPPVEQARIAIDQAQKASGLLDYVLHKTRTRHKN